MLLEDVERREHRRGQAARHWPDERDPVRAEIEERTSRAGPPTTSTSAPGTRGARKRRPRINASAASTDEQRRPAHIAERTDPRGELAHAVSPEVDVPVSFGSSPMTTSTAAPARKPVTTARERNRAIQPRRSTASRRKSAPVTSVIAATSSAASTPPTLAKAPPRPRRRRATSSARSRCGATCRTARRRSRRPLPRRARSAPVRRRSRRSRDPSARSSPSPRSRRARRRGAERGRSAAASPRSAAADSGRGPRSLTRRCHRHILTDRREEPRPPQPTRSAGLPRRRLRTRIVSPARLLTTTWEEAVLAAYTFGQVDVDDVRLLHVDPVVLAPLHRLRRPLSAPRHRRLGQGRLDRLRHPVAVPGRLRLSDRRGQGRWGSGA